MFEKFESYETDPDTLPEFPTLTRNRVDGRLHVMIHANTAEKVAAWSEEFPGPTFGVDIVAVAQPPIFVLTIPFILNAVVLDIFRVILADQTTQPGPLLQALVSQRNMDVIVFDSSGRSVACRSFEIDFLTSEELKGLLDRFPPTLTANEIAQNYNELSDILSDNAALQRIMQHEGISELSVMND